MRRFLFLLCSLGAVYLLLGLGPGISRLWISDQPAEPVPYRRVAQMPALLQTAEDRSAQQTGPAQYTDLWLHSRERWSTPFQVQGSVRLPNADANGNILQLSTYRRSVYQAVVLGDDMT